DKAPRAIDARARDAAPASDPSKGAPVQRPQKQLTLMGLAPLRPEAAAAGPPPPSPTAKAPAETASRPPPLPATMATPEPMRTGPSVRIDPPSPAPPAPSAVLPKVVISPALDAHPDQRETGAVAAAAFAKTVALSPEPPKLQIPSAI